MRTVTAQTLLLLAAGLCLATAPLVQQGPDTEVRHLVRMLGSERFTEREDATRRLLRMEEAEPALRQALHSRDREVARQARRLLAGYELNRRN